MTHDIEWVRPSPARAEGDRALVAQEVGPRASEWVPALLDQLLDQSAADVRALLDRAAARADRAPDAPDVPSSAHACDSPQTWGRTMSWVRRDLLDAVNADGSDPETGVATETYCYDLVRWALRYDDNAPQAGSETEFDERLADTIETRLTSFLNGQTAYWDPDIDVLRAGPLAVAQHATTRLGRRPHRIRLVLDGPAWTDVADERTAARSLDAIAAFAEAFDVAVVWSPRAIRHLRRHHREWWDEHGEDGLTQARTLSRTTAGGSRAAATSDDEDDDTAEATALAALTSLDEQGGRVRLLASLPAADADETRTVRQVKADPEVDVAEGTVDRYVGDLADFGVITVRKDSTASNRLTRTPAGDIVAECITPDYGLRDPSQASLERYLTPTLQPTAGSVYRAGQGREDPSPAGPAAGPESSQSGPETPSDGDRVVDSLAAARDGRTAEDVLAATGKIDEGASYVQWLRGRDAPSEGVLDAYGMHARYRAARRTAGVTVHDDQLERFEDGRVGYLSCFDDDALAIVQWGGCVATLGRITGVLLSGLARSKLLTEDALGEEFEQVANSVRDEFEDDVDRLITHGRQVGWFGEDEHDIEGWESRYGGVLSFCLEQVGKLSGSTDWEARGLLLDDLHGLLASTTQLYDAAGIDLTINLRVPDTYTLRRDDSRYQEFLDFIRYTVPKQTVYRDRHSGFRQNCEHREEKLKARLPVAEDVDPDDPTCDLTASWVVSGPDMSESTAAIERALDREKERVRDRVREGEERAPVIDIPVVESNTVGHVRQVLRRVAGGKGFITDREAVVDRDARDRRDIERVERTLFAALGRPGSPRRANVCDVTEALLHLGRSRRGGALTVRDLQHALAHLPSNRLLPTLTPGATRILQALLLADEPVGRSAVIDAGVVSESTWDRHIGTLDASGLVAQHSVSGRTKRTASIEPWWAPLSPEDEPPGDGEDVYGLGGSPLLRDVIEVIARTTDPDLPDDAWCWPPDLDRALEEAIGIEPWLSFIAAHFGTIPSEWSVDGHEDGSSQFAPVSEPPHTLSEKLPDGEVKGWRKTGLKGWRKIGVSGQSKTSSTTPTGTVDRAGDDRVRRAVIGALPDPDPAQSTLAEGGDD